MPAVRPPLQERSRRTLDRILIATEELLDEKLFEEVTIQEIVQRSGTSVGSFYARFPSKDALLPALYERYDRGFPRTPEEFLRKIPPAKSLVERVEQAVSAKLRIFTKRRGLMRAMAIYARVSPDSIAEEVRARRRALHEAVAGLLLEFEDEITHPEPKVAAMLGLFMVSATLRDKILYGAAPHASAVRISIKALQRELVRNLLSYLTCPQPPPSSSRNKD